MAIFSTSNPLAFTFGLLGNIISFAVFLAPFPTFIRIFKKKSTEGFDSLPYLVSLFSAMLWIYYASQKSDVFLLITINGFGCVIETLYIALYIAYAPKQPRMYTLRVLFLMNFGAFSAILLLTYFLTKGPLRVQVLGWICVAFATSVFASPLSVMRQVIRTKSVEFMPFSLSFTLTISAVVWLVYGISLKDLYVALPNVLGCVFGVAQMILYGIYKNHKTTIVEEKHIPEKSVVDEVKLDEIVVEEIRPPKCTEENENKNLIACNHQANLAENNLNILQGSRAIQCAAW